MVENRQKPARMNKTSWPKQNWKTYFPDILWLHSAAISIGARVAKQILCGVCCTAQQSPRIGAPTFLALLSHGWSASTRLCLVRLRTGFYFLREHNRVELYWNLLEKPFEASKVHPLSHILDLRGYTFFGQSPHLVRSEPTPAAVKTHVPTCPGIGHG
jgi:hypothetical protein